LSRKVESPHTTNIFNLPNKLIYSPLLGAGSSSSSSSSPAGKPATTKKKGAAMDEEDEDGGGAPSSPNLDAGGGGDGDVDPSIAAAVSSTRAGRALELQAGTGAGAGHEDRVRAGAGGEGVVGRLNPLDLLTNTLHWRHMAPTAPDTLACHPFHESDPFVIDRIPGVYFAGGQRGYGTRLVEGGGGEGGSSSVRVRVISVPDFATTLTAVLVDIASPTLDAQPLCFGVGGGGGVGGDLGLRLKVV
jgi:hypothetical protein